MKIIKYIFIFFLLGKSFVNISVGQTDPKKITRILFVFDASNSMYGQWDNKSKISVAKKILSETIDEMRDIPNLQVALRIYGHQSYVYDGNQDCEDTRLEVPFRWLNHQKIKDKIRDVIPKGTTPIALSLEKSADDFPDTLARNVVILITDGIEACDMDPCAVSRALHSKGIKVKPFVVGLDIDTSYLAKLQCVGTYFDAKDPDVFANIMKVVVSQAISNTTYQISLNDGAGTPVNSNVPVTIEQSKPKSLHDYYIHTLNDQNNPDTLAINPVYRYNFNIHTIPPLVRDSVEIIAGEHNVIAFDAPMGTLSLSIDNAQEYGDLKCLIRHKDFEKTLHAQEFNTTERYIAGKYDLELLTLPRMFFDDVEILENHDYPIAIPGPGVVQITKSSQGFGAIFLKEEGSLRWVCNTMKEMGTERYAIQPGEYVYIFRAKYAQETLYTIKKEFTINTGTSINISI